MYDFQYSRAKSVDEAVASLRAGGEGAKFLAGGMTLIPTLKQRLAQPSLLVDLGGISELVGIRLTQQAIEIGAMTTHAAVATSAELRSRIPALAELAAGIGDRQVRHRGTIGGSVANNDPAADYPAAVLALQATIVTNRREIAADDYFRGLFETALQRDEIIVALRFPIPSAAGYSKFASLASRYAVVGVFVARTAGRVRVAVTGAGQAGVFRASALEHALVKDFSAEAIGMVKTSADGLASDLNASPEYRAHLIPVITQRAVIRACAA